MIFNPLFTAFKTPGGHLSFFNESRQRGRWCRWIQLVERHLEFYDKIIQFVKFEKNTKGPRI